MANVSNTCNVAGLAPRCQLLQAAITGQGPFAACLPMGAAVIQDAYNDCLFDVCQGASNCDSYETFVDTCLTELPCK
uniref:VWF/SSPO/Zonadhesin-like cysteine-rich domain-containing protein n=1 Tax=Panagrolaimus sp. JU765 TaxID=591449 RepID=A0AC34Q9X4_9BILA